MSAFTTTWNDVATHIKTTYEVEMEWPDAVGFLLPGGRSSHRILLGTNNPGFGGVDYITMDAFLGPTSDVDVIRAAQCAHRLLGGVDLGKAGGAGPDPAMDADRPDRAHAF